MNKQENKDKGHKGNEIFQCLAYFSHLGVTMAACVLIGVLLGKYLDRLLGTSPWLVLIFSLLGAGAAIKAMFNIPGGKG